MENRLTLSQYKLATFLACQRRFQLRYLRHLPWPNSPFSRRTEASLRRGQEFHQLLERYFLGLNIAAATIADGQMSHWWQQFKAHWPFGNDFAANARFLPESGLTIPLGEHLLYGRFDLLVLGENENGTPSAHIFDWKTGKPANASELNGRWQTRLYLALLAEGGNAFWPENVHLVPEQISLTYWYVQAADTPITIGYSTAAHQSSWAELQEHAALLTEVMAKDSWPLTDILTHCRDCAYQSYCRRQDAGTTVPEIDEMEEPTIANAQLLTPELP
ncbi:MAG: PD-(D/E)XK nuclease family protein [Chloroflexi bacterium]|nr:PD-(D/E)XK nuclease family protein [Chloroflexota bacterium]